MINEFSNVFDCEMNQLKIGDKVVVLTKSHKIVKGKIKRIKFDFTETKYEKFSFLDQRTGRYKIAFISLSNGINYFSWRCLKIKSYKKLDISIALISILKKGFYDRFRRK